LKKAESEWGKMMKKEYRMDREYSPTELIRYHLKMWWLALIFGLICAAMLGGYKYASLKPFLEDNLYEDRMQVRAALFVSNYSEGSVGERANNVIRMAKSNRAYRAFCEETENAPAFGDYQEAFELEQSEASDVLTLYVTYPSAGEEPALSGEEEALAFAESLIAVIGRVSEEMTGADCISVLDAPYVTQEVVKVRSFSVSAGELSGGVFKAATAGLLLGVIVEVVCYSLWMLLCRRPKDAEEIRKSLDTAVIGVTGDGKDKKAVFGQAALYLKDDAVPCNRICCLPVGCPDAGVAETLAQRYAGEQKKTLLIDLADGRGGAHSISRFLLGQEKTAEPQKISEYLDAVCRDAEAEQGMDPVCSRRFAGYLDEMSSCYECIVIGSRDAGADAEGFAAAKLCGKVFVACGRKSVKTETLYAVRNAAELNDITIDGVLVYER